MTETQQPASQRRGDEGGGGSAGGGERLWRALLHVGENWHVFLARDSAGTY